jgi:hypothetical protein
MGVGGLGGLLTGCRLRSKTTEQTTDHLIFHLKIGGRDTKIRFQKRLLKSPLAVNERLTLRRYTGGSGPALTAREKQLVVLAQNASVEEAFVYTQPDEVWTEIGVRTEKGANSWRTFGVRNLPLKFVLHLFSGRYPGFSRPTHLTNYHIHPIQFVRRSIRTASLPHSYERMAYLPSFADFFVAARRGLVLAARGIHHRSKVAVPDAIIEYRTSSKLARRAALVSKPRALKELDTYEDALIHYVQTNLKRDDFPAFLKDRMQWAGFAGDEFQMTIKRI